MKSKMLFDQLRQASRMVNVSVLWHRVRLFQSAQGPPASEEFHCIHRRGAAGGGQVRQQPAPEYSSSQALPAGPHTQRVGEVQRRWRVQGLGAQGQLNHLPLPN